MRLCFPALLSAILITLAMTVYPLILAGADGKADHWLAMVIFWAMSAGYVRGVGFVPHNVVLRWWLSGWAVCVALGIAAALFYFRNF